jgi:DNA-binding MarR family transcriptional regulator/GNAT superfamily N-acetyltransferase
MASISAAQIARVRAFNREYTRRIGVLSEGLLDSPYSLTEARVMYEIAHRRDITAGELAADLDLDRGYLSRVLKGFETKKLLVRTPSAEDGRRHHLRLTPAGTRVFAPLEKRSQKQVRDMFSTLDEERRRSVLAAMDTIEGALGLEGQPQRQLTLRAHRPGDIGWVVQRHGEIYHQEYGFNEEFEALVAEIAAAFVRNFDAAREHCWIAEHAGRRVGCIFLVAKDATTAKLRLLLVEPDARGLGVGRTLVSECVRFALAAGYHKIVLWTQDNLTAARRIYSNQGFVKTGQEVHRSFGQELVAETWELGLRTAHEPTSA